MNTVIFNSKKELSDVQSAIFAAAAFAFNYCSNAPDIENHRRAYDLFVQLENAKKYINNARANSVPAND